MPIGARKQGLDDHGSPIGQRDGGNVAVDPVAIHGFVEEPREECEIGHLGAVRATIEVAAPPQRRAMRDDHSNACIEGTTQTERIVQLLETCPLRCKLGPAMGEERHAKARERTIKRITPRGSRIDTLRRGQPFDRSRAVGHRRFESSHRVASIRMNRCGPLKAVGTRFRQRRRTRVRNIECRALAHRRPALVVKPIESQQDGGDACGHAVELLLEARNDARVDAPGLIVDAGRVEIEEALHEQCRVSELRHRGVEPEVVARVSIAEKMAVRVPDLGRVETMPGGRNQRVRGQFTGQSRIACVAQTFPQGEVAA